MSNFHDARLLHLTWETIAFPQLTSWMLMTQRLSSLYFPWKCQQFFFPPSPLGTLPLLERKCLVFFSHVGAWVCTDVVERPGFITVTKCLRISIASCSPATAADFCGLKLKPFRETWPQAMSDHERSDNGWFGIAFSLLSKPAWICW